MDPTAWIRVIETTGVIGAVLLTLLWGLYRAASWIGANVAIPARDRLIDRAIKLADKVDTVLDRLDQNILLMSANLSAQTEAIKDLRQEMRARHEEILRLLNSRGA